MSNAQSYDIMLMIVIRIMYLFWFTLELMCVKHKVMIFCNAQYWFSLEVFAMSLFMHTLFMFQFWYITCVYNYDSIIVQRLYITCVHYPCVPKLQHKQRLCKIQKKKTGLQKIVTKAMSKKIRTFIHLIDKNILQGIWFILVVTCHVTYTCTLQQNKFKMQQEGKRVH